MNVNRQTLLVLLGVGGLVLFIGFRLINWGVVQPLTTLDSDIKNADKARGELALRLKNLSGAPTDWAALVERSLSSDAQKAQQLFREDVAALLVKHGLTEDLKLTSQIHRKREMGKGELPLVEAPVSIQVRGTLDQLVNFLTDFYRREYLARIESISITAESGPAPIAAAPPPAPTTPANGNRGGRNTPPRTASPTAAARANAKPAGQLSINLTAATLVLPADPKMAVGTNVGESEAGLPQPLEDYARIHQNNIFKEWVAVVVKNADPVDNTNKNENDNKTVVRATPPRDERLGKEKILLVGTAMMDGQPIVFVRDTGDLTKSPEQHSLNDSVDDGKLVLVHQKGMVVRVPNARGAGDAEGEADESHRDFFYRLGESFAERDELNPEQYPEIAQQLELAFSKPS